MAAFGPTMLWVFLVNIRCFGRCGWRFRPYGESLWQTPQRNQRSGPRRTARSLGLGVPSLRVSSGGIASGLLRCTSSRCVRLRRTALRAYPRMNPETKPAEGAGTSRAAAELTLILLSGEKPRGVRCGLFLLLLCCGSEPAREGGLIADLFLSDVRVPTVGVSLLAMTP